MDVTIKFTNYPYVIERIKGIIHKMARPSMNHISAGANLSYLFMRHFWGKECRFYPEPAVQLGDDSVSPDACVVCDLTKVHDMGIVGVPDLVIEILSPSTKKKDEKDKFQLYEEHLVREYWLVDPKSGSVQIWVLSADSKFVLTTTVALISEGEKESLREHNHHHLIVEQFTSTIFPDLTIQLSDLFEYLE